MEQPFDVFRLTTVLKLPTDTHIALSRSIRQGTQSMVLRTYQNFQYYLNNLSKQKTTTGYLTTRSEFNTILGSLLVALAHSEPSGFQSYNNVYIVKIGGVEMEVRFAELISRITCTPIQFLCAHANTVYEFGRTHDIRFDFGTFSSMEPNLPGVGFIGYPFVEQTTNRELEMKAFRTILDKNEHVRKWYFENKLW